MSISVSTLALAAASIGAGGATDATAPSDVTALQERVVALEEQIEVLTGQPQGGWLTQDEEAMRALVNEVLLETEGRTNWRQGGAVAGHDGRFFLASPDGNFRLNVGGQLQVRYVYNQFDDNDVAGADGSRGGFENRRTKLTFDGHVFDPTVEYTIQGRFDFDGGLFALEDAIIGKEFGNGWQARLGQFKVPFLREELVSSKRQLAVERSLINAQFTGGRSQGVEFANEAGDNFRYMVMFSDGFGAANTAAVTPDVSEWAFTGRVEALLAGDDWNQFRDFTSFQDEDEFAFMLGGAAHAEEGEHGTPVMEAFFWTWTVDGSAEWGGANLYGAFIGRHVDTDGGADTDDYGAVVQGGWFLQEDVELFGRYEWGDLETGGDSEINVVTVGFNKYWEQHALKWTTDFGYAFDEITAPWASAGAGWRTDAGGEDGQWVVRSQVQLLF